MGTVRAETVAVKLSSKWRMEIMIVGVSSACFEVWKISDSISVTLASKMRVCAGDGLRQEEDKRNNRKLYSCKGFVGSRKKSSTYVIFGKDEEQLRENLRWIALVLLSRQCLCENHSHDIFKPKNNLSYIKRSPLETSKWIGACDKTGNMGSKV